MSISAALFVLVKSGAAIRAGQQGYSEMKSYLNPLPSGLPQTRLECVDELNRVLPPGRPFWSADRLFLFMAAFAIVGEDGKSVSWIRDRQDLKKLLVRGYRLNAESIQRVDCALDAAFEDVIEGLGRYPTTTLTRQEEKEFSWPRTTQVSATLGAAVLGPIGFGLLAGFTVGAIKAAELRNENARKNIARVIAGALLFGGLSTSETAAILIEQGTPEADVSQILRA